MTNTTTLTIDGFTLTAAQVVSVARAPHLPVTLAQSSRTALKESRDFNEYLLNLVGEIAVFSFIKVNPSEGSKGISCAQ